MMLVLSLSVNLHVIEPMIHQLSVESQSYVLRPIIHRVFQLWKSVVKELLGSSTDQDILETQESGFSYFRVLMMKVLYQANDCVSHVRADLVL